MGGGIVESFRYNTSEINYSVAGALKHYDLPDLLENLSITNPLVLHENTELKKNTHYYLNVEEKKKLNP